MMFAVNSSTLNVSIINLVIPENNWEQKIEDVKKYCLERENKIIASNFIDFYTSKGWFVGKTKMKDWQASVRVWEQRKKKDTKSEDTYKTRGVIPADPIRIKRVEKW